MNSLRLKIQKEIEQLGKLDAWVARWCPNLNLGTVFASGSSLNFLVYCYDWNRQDVLREIAETFGTSDWMSHEEDHKMHWTRTLDGVEMKISDVADVPPPRFHPVPISAWPMQLSDGVSICSE